MAGCVGRGRGTPALVGLAFLLTLSGCGKKEAAPAPEPGQNAAVAPGPASETAGTTANARLSQPFIDATLSEPSDALFELLPTTMTNKSIGKLYEDTVEAWGHISFLTPAGKRIHYSATLETDLGPIDIELKPDVAPNHVRNFIALARVGYYDGLIFERLVRQVAENDPTNRVELVEAGSPIGNSDAHYGSIGYWLKPEFLDQVPEPFKDQAKHEEGAVGACLLDRMGDTGAVRFFILLTNAPSLDGEQTIFGKVTRGLDLVRRIASQPESNSPDLPAGTPEKPIVIHKVTIRATEVDKAAVAVHNK